MSAWQQVNDDQGRVYYYNSETQETSWENPEAPLAGSWITYTTDDGKQYYYNEATGETTWDKPAELGTPAEASKDQDAETPGGTDGSTTENSDMLLELDRKLALEPLVDSTLVNLPAPKSAEDARVCFQAMLEEGGVDSTWSFEKVIRTFIKNQSYWAIGDAVQRRTVYEDYLVSKLQKESSNKSGLIEEFKKNFVLEIQAYLSLGKVTHTTRWVSAKNLLIKEQNPVFEHSILPDNELERLFNECTEKVRSRIENDIQKQKDQALGELEGYLLQVTAGNANESLTWDQLYARLQTDARFRANKHFHVLTKLDILLLYSSKIYPVLVSKIQVQIANVEKANHRSDRHARDAYKALLRSKTITANTRFQDLLPELENEDAFIELCGRNGLTPLELFWDIVEELKQLQKVKKDLIEHSLRAYVALAGALDYEDTLASFLQFVSTLKLVNDERLVDVDTSSEQGTKELALVYETLRGELQVHRQNEQVLFERKRDSCVHALAEWICSHRDDLDPSILVLEKHTEIPAIAEENATTASGPAVIAVGSREALVKTSHVDSASWRDKMGGVDAFSKLTTAVDRHYAKAPEKAEPALNASLSQCLKEVASVLTGTLSRKRVAAEPPSQEAKRSRPEGEKKPVLMNY